MKVVVDRSWTRAKNIARGLGRRIEPKLLLASLVVTGGIWAFIELADEVKEGETRAIDEWILRSFRSPADLSQAIGPHWLAEAARDVTALGSVSVLVLITAIVAGFLCLVRRYRDLLFLLSSTILGSLATFVMKRFFARPRPSIVPHLAEVSTASFPSGHSMQSAVIYLTLGALLAAILPQRRQKIYVLAIALLLTGLVGISRVFLGVHYPTDVLGGWGAGLTWALASWLVYALAPKG